MTDNTANKKLRIIHPFLFGIYPVIFLYSRNVGEVNLKSMIIPAVAVIAFTFIIMLVLRCVIKDRNKLGIILTGFWFYFFTYGNVYGKLDELTIGGKLVGTNVFLIPAWTAVFLLAVMLVLIFPKKLTKLTRILNVVAVCFVVMCLASITFNYVKSAATNKKVAEIDHAAGFPEPSEVPSELPDIYYIILDGRVRSDILKEHFGYDDSVFLTQLAERGFFVADKSNSNYMQTKLSIISTLHCMYMDDLVSQYRERLIRGSVVDAMFKTNRVFELLKKCGYTTVSFPSGYVNVEFRDADIFYSDEPSFGPIFDEYINELVSNMVIAPVFAGFQGRQTLHAYRNRVLYAFEKLGETAKLESPHFVFCHIISPHIPYVFDENGIIDQPNRPFRWTDTLGLTREERNRKYVGQLKFINKKTIEAIDDILANSKKPPVIILQADHGARWECVSDGKPNDYRSYFGILNAYHLPGGDNSQLYKTISPVNSFRVILNQYFGANLKLLEDRSYYSTDKQLFDFIDKTEQIK